MEDCEWLAALIERYLADVRALSRQLGESFGQADLFAGRRGKAIPRTGVAPNGLEFRFHGIGCWISDGVRSVDFDFLPDGTVGGFDGWRLHVFTEENPSLGPVRSESEVQRALDRLEAEGRITSVQGSTLYQCRALVPQM